MEKHLGRVAKKREKFDVAFLDFEDLVQIEKDKNIGGINIRCSSYTFDERVSGSFKIKKIVNPVIFEMETTNGVIDITKDDVLIVKASGEMVVISKDEFNLGYEEIK